MALRRHPSIDLDQQGHLTVPFDHKIEAAKTRQREAFHKSFRRLKHGGALHHADNSGRPRLTVCHRYFNTDGGQHLTLKSKNSNVGRTPGNILLRYYRGTEARRQVFSYETVPVDHSSL